MLSLLIDMGSKQNIYYKIEQAPLQPSFCQREDLGTSNHDVLSQECSCVNSSFL